MFLKEDFFQEFYSSGTKFREEVFLGIFFQGVFLPIAQNSRTFSSYRGKKKSRVCAIAQNSLPLTSIIERGGGPQVNVSNALANLRVTVMKLPGAFAH